MEHVIKCPTLMDNVKIDDQKCWKMLKWGDYWWKKVNRDEKVKNSDELGFWFKVTAKIKNLKRSWMLMQHVNRENNEFF